MKKKHSTEEALGNLIREILSARNNDYVGPTQVKRGDVRIGTLNDDLVRLWALLGSYKKKVKKIADEMGKIGSDHLKSHLEKTETESACKEFSKKATQLTEVLRIPGLRLRVLHEIFWGIVEELFPGATKKKVKIRDGEKLVSTNEDDDDSNLSVVFSNLYAAMEGFADEKVTHGLIIEILVKPTRDPTTQRN